MRKLKLTIAALVLAANIPVQAHPVEREILDAFVVAQSACHSYYTATLVYLETRDRVSVTGGKELDKLEKLLEKQADKMKKASDDCLAKHSELIRIWALAIPYKKEEK